ncbi:MAG: cob(I)yrinic acid a,c-diamide adenosyltransferase [Planctomycetes bacterium]|nr:cob(I)yrinic acid a,c-diamide adenosyltransferase [Planctomycetota bacterium]
MVTLSCLTTRTGDSGTTGLADGSRLDKCHPLIAAIGSVDEANSLLGLALAAGAEAAAGASLRRVQNDLFDLGSDLASPPGGPHEDRIPRVTASQVAALDEAVGAATARLEPMRSFILPGGSPSAAWLHLARTVVRRAERDLVAAQRAEPGRGWNPECLRYLNRLSDACFAWARLANDGGRADVAWKPGAGR